MHLRSRGLVLAVVVAATVAACQPAASTAPTSAPASVAPGSGAPSASAALPTGESITIGAAMALTGDFSPDTKLVRDGYEFAVARINELGGITVGGEQRPIELIVRDDGSDREVSARLLEQLIAEDEVDLLLAPWGSGNTNAVAPISERYGRVMVAPLAASDSIWEQGYEHLFGILPLGSDSLRGTMRMAADLGVTRIGAITTDDLFPALSHEGVIDEADQLGLEVVVNEIYPPGTLDVGAIITQLQESEADFVLAPVDVADAIVLVQQMQQRDYRPAGLSLAGATFVPDFLTNVGDAADGLYGFVYWHRTLPTSDAIFGTSEEFAQAFEADFGYQPTHDTAAALAAVSVLKLAVEAADSLEQTAVRDAMRAIDVDTVFGPIKFDPAGYNLALKYPYTVQQQDLELTVVYPADQAGAEPVYPVAEWGRLR